MVSRRTVLAALPATALAVSLPAAATENPADRVCRLMKDLSQALGEYFGGSFRAIVDPDTLPGGTYYLHSVSLPTIVPPGRMGDVSSPELVDLLRAVDRHRRAWQALEAACPAADDSSPRFDPVSGPRTWARLDRAEQQAKRAFLRFPVATDQGQRAKAAYLRECCDEFRVPFLERDFNDLVDAMERA